ncbi:hypothetical protein [Chengkuizengella axinellae]|uniref:Uncharacterized protein n=1 Tax=Chengkuizengella axinellae TaxID=3064388 RepID=A0ABT9J2N2_9BACL|nr:hypothetical protein [Chengkuizengella sp. 2205SS18-9]MDP5275280.1 hypothetical protein [Chengkuizengella sp. 2205SS18-9]
MGFFQESICDCCYCPMQFALKQFEGEVVFISTLLDPNIELNLSSVEDFIVFGTMNGDRACVPVSEIFSFASMITKPPAGLVKPIQKSVKGKCGCIEDPMTNKFNVGDIVSINGSPPLQVNAVGEGIVVVNLLDSPIHTIISICNVVFSVEFLPPTTTNQAINTQS